MDLVASELSAQKHADELRETWQARVLARATGRMMLAVTSMLAHVYEDAMPVLLRVVKPLCWDAEKQSLKAPFFCSIAKINKSGQIVADAILFNGGIRARDRVVFASVRDYEYELRKLADIARLSDHDRKQFFIVARKWVASDMRLDPTMNPADPGARRLVH